MVVAMTNPMNNPVAPVVREYIEIGAGYVVATKGDGSTYRIHAPDDAERVIVLPEFYHPFYTQMAKAIAAEREAASGELERLRQDHAFMKDQIQKLDQIMTNSIKENDGPNRVNIDGVWHEGPVVENYFKVLRKMQTAYRLILERVS